MIDWDNINSNLNNNFNNFKPSCTSVNDTIKSLLSRKQETAKKTFGFYSEIKSRKNVDEILISEKLEKNSKFINKIL